MPSPIISATLQAATLSTASNICAQWFQAHRENRLPTLDLVPLLHFVTLAFITVPPNYLWQQFLEQQFPAYPSGRKHEDSNDMEKGGVDVINWKEGRGEPGGPKLSIQNTMIKWFIDCITAGAIMNTLAFLIVMGILKCEPTWQIWHNIQMVSFHPCAPHLPVLSIPVTLAIPTKK
ncbi:Fc.00g079090.m01.CDS01 [Cosmosporella sp. VM-42]